MEKKPLSNIAAGLILFLLMVVYTFIINLGNLQGNTALSWLSYVIVTVGILFFVFKYAKDKEGNITFGNLFAYGFKTTAVLIVFDIAFMIIFFLLFPEYKERIFEIGREKAMQNANGANAENMEKGMEILRRFFWVGLIAGIMFSFAILGAIGSLLGAALAKKNPDTFHHDVNQIGS